MINEHSVAGDDPEYCPVLVNYQSNITLPYAVEDPKSDLNFLSNQVL